MLSASLLAAAYLWAPASGEMSIEMMLEKDQILAAVGTLSYMSEVRNMCCGFITFFAETYM